MKASTFSGFRWPIVVAATLLLTMACDTENVIQVEGNGNVDTEDGSEPDTSTPDTTPDTGGPDTGGPDTGGPDSSDDGDTNNNTNACDMTGTWGIRVWTISEALGIPACANNFYYMEIDQNGDAFSVTRGASCNFQITKTTTTMTEKLAEELLRRSEDGLIAADESIPDDKNNSQTGRMGRFYENGDGECVFQLDRWWLVRGADFTTYLPDKSDYTSDEILKGGTRDLDDSAPLPNEDNPAGNVDVENDGNPGLTLNVESPATADRYTSQRDWTEIREQQIHVIEEGNRFDVRLDFDNSEGLLGASNQLVNQASTAAQATDRLGHVATFYRLDSDMPAASAGVEAMRSFCRDEIESVFDTRSRDLTDTAAACCEKPVNVESGAFTVPEVCEIEFLDP